MKTLLLITMMLFFTACGGARNVPVATVVQASEREWIVIKDKCTTYLTWTPEYGLVAKVSDMMCGDYNATVGDWISRNIPGSSVVVEGEQWIMIRVSEAERLYEKLGDENIIEFISKEQYMEMSEDERLKLYDPNTAFN